ncbi:MAG: M55 family metallopeptidase [Thermomicrobiales bacterium]
MMTDQEGSAGVVDAPDYNYRTSKYYERARQLVTGEVNAAIEGILETGDHEIIVVDGHGQGAIDLQIIHPAVRVLTGRPLSFAFGFDGSFDALLFVGQHAKSNTDGGHLSHTMSFTWDDFVLNGLSIGELGYYMALAGEFDVPTILVTGDQAACDEAQMLVPGIETAVVKEGWKSGPATDLTGPQNELHNGGAYHLAPSAAQDLIRQKATQAVERIGDIPPFRTTPPYDLVTILRPVQPGGPRQIARNFANDLLTLGAMSRTFEIEPTGMG